MQTIRQNRAIRNFVAKNLVLRRGGPHGKSRKAERCAVKASLRRGVDEAGSFPG